jgi:hypothetical protein
MHEVARMLMQRGHIEREEIAIKTHMTHTLRAHACSECSEGREEYVQWFESECLRS